ncbi:MAG: HAD-IIA family hydrolase [Candidatus Hodarchaeales archaeon]
MKASNPNELLEDIRVLIFDCDGVLWRGKTAIPNSIETIEAFREIDFKIFFLTNNSTKTVDKVKEKFNHLGFEAEGEEIITSAVVAADFLKEKQVKSVNVVGEEGLVAEITVRGITVDSSRNDCEAVAVGMDRKLTYNKIALAAQNVINGALFIGTNPDPFFPTEKGIFPGAGSCIAAIETAAGRKVDYQLGKPNKIMFKPFSRMGFEPQECLVIGDMIRTDIMFAKNSGCKSLLIDSKAANNEFEKYPDCHPDFYLKDIGELREYIR